MKKYDTLVIGSGGGAKFVALTKMGEHVALIEKGPLGGTCPNRGCIPSKKLIHLADKMRSFAELSQNFPVTFSGGWKLDWRKFITEVANETDGVAESIRKGYSGLPGLDLYQGEARFTGAKTIEVNGETLEADRIIIATGATPAIPNVPGLEGTPFMTSTQALRADNPPKHLLILGGGYIAVELGYFYAMMGVEVTFLVRNQLLGNEDETIQSFFDQKFCSKFRVIKLFDTESVEYKYGNFFVKGRKRTDGINSEVSLTFVGDALLVATGIEPATKALGLEKAGVNIDKKGFITVNEYLETSASGVYALGDVIGKYAFRHSVNFEAEYLLAQFAEKKRTPLVYPPMPHAVFTYPQIAGVGETEKMLRARGLVEGKDYISSSADYRKTGMGAAMRSDGLVKILVDIKTHKILGAHIVGDKSADIIHSLIAQMTLGATLEQCLEMIYIHPALGEVVRMALRKALERVNTL